MPLLSQSFTKLPRLSEDDGLTCPSCGHDNLHQENVHVFFRKEDAEDGVQVSVQGRAVWGHEPADVPVSVFTDQEGNPSPRRDGIEIEFWCECCPAHPRLAIMQHKGSTYMEWR